MARHQVGVSRGRRPPRPLGACADLCLACHSCELCTACTAVPARFSSVVVMNQGDANGSLYDSDQAAKPLHRAPWRRRQQVLSEKEVEEFRQVFQQILKQMEHPFASCRDEPGGICMDELCDHMDTIWTKIPAEDIESMVEDPDCRRDGSTDSNDFCEEFMQDLELEGLTSDLATTSPSSQRLDLEMTTALPMPEDHRTGLRPSMLDAEAEIGPPSLDEDNEWLVRLPGPEREYVSYLDFFQLISPVGYR
eukprot:gnl/TRDRNA2_/TRDRNA2_94628_c0_seq1.p1 gnl/TRDRNA2_/TRDRNA2_94628_c0~~gnl/TRDRNA2_/TRDRNA2_94628_c0_seq1.p1  ORF type:complete len:250 (-),score=27.74 gnl/TRDRNA2_/TRDRNA2_94628_c0_seq1:19-768(-)